MLDQKKETADQKFMVLPFIKTEQYLQRIVRIFLIIFYKPLLQIL